MRARGPITTLLGALALATPAAAAAEPVLRSTPRLTFQAPDRIQLTFRLDAALATRFDGEVLGRARISADGASLYPVGRADRHCYAARVRPGPLRVGRRYTVRLFLSADDPAPLELVIALQRARRGDARGARLGC